MSTLGLRTGWILALVVSLGGGGALGAPTRKPAARAPRPTSARLLSLTVTPARVGLSGLSARQRLLVTGRFSDGSERDLTREAAYSLRGKAARLSERGVIAP